MKPTAKKADEQVADYLHRSGSDRIEPATVVEDDHHGWANYRVSGDALVILDCYGDGHFWDAWFQRRARELGCSQLVFSTKRNPEAWRRMLGYELVGYVMAKPVEQE